MSRDRYRSPDLGPRDRWQRDRPALGRDGDRDGPGRLVEGRYEYTDRIYRRGGSPPAGLRERSLDRYPDRRPPPPRRYPAAADDDDNSTFGGRYYPRRGSPPPPPRDEADRRDLRYGRSPSPPPRRGVARPPVLRRQSSLDIFDRPSPRLYYDEPYGPPARRDQAVATRPTFDYGDYRPDPLPRSRGLPPPPPPPPPPAPVAPRPRYDDYDGGRRRDDDYDGGRRRDDGLAYGDDVEYRETEMVRRTSSATRHASHDHHHRRRGRSRSRSRSHTHRRRSRSSSTSSRSSNTTEVKPTYPKKGRTRFPARLVSKRVLIDLGYSFEEDGNTITVLLALGQKDIDEVLRLSEQQKRAADIEFERTRIEAQREHVARATAMAAPPVVLPPPPVDVVDSETTLGINRTRSESGDIPLGPLALVQHAASSSASSSSTDLTSRPRSRRRSRHSRSSRSRSAGPRGERAIDAEIRALEAERDAMKLERRQRRLRRKRRSASRHGSDDVGDELVRYSKRLEDGQLVMYEEHVRDELVRDDGHHRDDDEYYYCSSDSDDHHHHHDHHHDVVVMHRGRGPRIERDKKGRMSISLPKRR